MYKPHETFEQELEALVRKPIADEGYESAVPME